MIENAAQLTTILTEALRFAEARNADRLAWHLRSAHIALGPSDAPRTVTVDVIAGRVMNGTAPVPLTRIELAVVVALAIHEHGLSRAELADLLYPDADGDRSINSVKVAIHRARRRARPENLVICADGRYRLASHVYVDLPVIERAVQRLRRAVSLDVRDCALLDTVRERTSTERPQFMRDWGWFEPIERRVCDLRRNACMMLARDALRRDQLDRAVEIAAAISHRDPLDEEAAEVVIRSFLRLGDRTAAVLAYRRYAREVQAELRLPPPQDLLALIDRYPERPTANGRNRM